MPTSKTIDILYNRIVNDERLSISHFSIYMALILLWYKNEMKNPFPMSRRNVMDLSHMHSIATYHKCLTQLQLYGYIQYYPSYSYYTRSTIYIENI